MPTFLSIFYFPDEITGGTFEILRTNYKVTEQLILTPRTYNFPQRHLTFPNPHHIPAGFCGPFMLFPEGVNPKVPKWLLSSIKDRFTMEWTTNPREALRVVEGAFPKTYSSFPRVIMEEVLLPQMGGAAGRQDNKGSSSGHEADDEDEELDTKEELSTEDDNNEPVSSGEEEGNNNINDDSNSDDDFSDGTLEKIFGPMS